MSNNMFSFAMITKESISFRTVFYLKNKINAGTKHGTLSLSLIYACTDILSMIEAVNEYYINKSNRAFQ